ncbi:MAG: retropepsin-like aspartic protease [Chloroherpetonaceae bacterium]|nr:retroviral-like aspartic protease family protein [Chloroherpetonaceae bacterium]MDW8020540.1 retropepsin-like aspartic protease [Chloroherpetonaceae bacterium]
MEMGRVKQTAFLQNSADLVQAQEGKLPIEKVRSLEVEFVVDTGAAYICLPKRMIEALGLVKQKEKDVRTANGIVKRSIFSPVNVKIFDRDTDLNVMELPDDGTPPLLGYLALEAMDLLIDAKEQKVIPNPANEGKWVIDCL